MFRLFFALFFVVLMAISCRRLPNVQGEGSASLQGIWNQDSVPGSDKLLSYTKHRYKFSCDSFYVDLVTYSKANYYADSCFNNGVWKEYAKGVYELRADTLFLLGTWTKANYKQKVSGCYHIGQYIRNFKIKTAEPGHLNLESIDEQRDINLVLKQQIKCVPQEL